MPGRGPCKTRLVDHEDPFSAKACGQGGRNTRWEGRVLSGGEKGVVVSAEGQHGTRWPAPHDTVCGEGAVLSEDRLRQARGKGGTRYTVGGATWDTPELAAAQRDARRIAVLLVLFLYGVRVSPCSSLAVTELRDPMTFGS